MLGIIEVLAVVGTGYSLLGAGMAGELKSAGEIVPYYIAAAVTSAAVAVWAAIRLQKTGDSSDVGA